MVGYIDLFSRNLLYSFKFGRTNTKAGIAFDAFILVNNMYHSFVSCDSLRRTIPSANTTSLAAIRENIIRG
jgi:hypothetical protein